MEIQFYTHEVDETKHFIRTELPSARFLHNPIKIGDEWNISLSMSVEDGNKLSLWRNK